MNRTFGTATFALVLIPSLAMARTWHIAAYGPSDAPSVQAGIDSAAAGDTVLVGIGTYFETINFKGKNIVVKSAEGPEQTFLNGSGKAGRVVSFVSGEGRSALLEGFTITAGQGGIIILNSEPTLTENKITGNSGAQDGGGVWCGGVITEEWSPLIENNVITDNIAQSLAGGVGADIMKCEVLNNRIERNEATNGDGGGIYYRSIYPGAKFTGNIIDSNVAGDHGGGIYVGRFGDGVLDLEVANNLVLNNHAKGQAMTGESGGGIWLWETNAWVHHNTVVGNWGEGPNNAYGGGIVIEQLGSPIIEQNIIAFSATGGGVWCGGGASPTIRNNLAWQNSGGDGVQDCQTWWQSNGNIVDNPYFCDMAGGDFRVAENSGVITHPAGPLGAFPIPGCGPVSILPSTWGSLKAKYGDH